MLGTESIDVSKQLLSAKTQYFRVILPMQVTLIPSKYIPLSGLMKPFYLRT
jgi:hypothetical protein